MLMEKKNESKKHVGIGAGVQDWQIFPIFSSKEVAKSSAVRKDREGRGGRLRSEETMVWSL